MGKGTVSSLKDVFLIDDNFNVKYIDKKGKEYGDSLDEKILEDETALRFSSKAFSEYISKISGVTEEEIKFKWMKNQTTLEITDSNITSLEDLVFFPNLTNLTLKSTNVTTLDGIENCRNLKAIHIIDEINKDYSAIAKLQNLVIFERNNGNDADAIIDVLKMCKSLEELTIQNAKMKSMSRVSKLVNLRVLNLHNNPIKKIEGLENLNKLEALFLSYTGITQIEGLDNLNNLKTLNLAHNNIKDITPLSANTSLMDLSLQGNKEIDRNRANYEGKKLEDLNKIGEILDRDGIINLDIDKLGLFTNYKKLTLTNQGLTTLEPLEGLTQLTFLNLDSNLLTLEDAKSQEILKSMTNLEVLSLGSNRITDVKAINSLTNLKKLELRGGNNNINLLEIEDIISNLSELKVSSESLKSILNCDVNKITQLSFWQANLTEIPELSKFNKLTKINLAVNPNISNFENISNLTNLQTLNLDYNNLHGRMINFSNLTNLTNLTLSNNSLWTEDLENLKALKNNKNLIINLSNNSIIDASALLELDASCRIALEKNINLTQESKNALKEKFGSNVSF